MLRCCSFKTTVEYVFGCSQPVEYDTTAVVGQQNGQKTRAKEVRCTTATRSSWLRTAIAGLRFCRMTNIFETFFDSATLFV
jgi:hypothetical protein